MQILSINTDISKIDKLCVINFNPHTGKLYAIHEPINKEGKNKSIENIITNYRKGWEVFYPSVYGIVEKSHDELVGIIQAKEKEGGNYYIKNPFLKSIQESPLDYEGIFGGAILQCDYTLQFYRNYPLEVINRLMVPRNDILKVIIRSEMDLPGTFKYKFRAKPEGNQDIEIFSAELGSLENGELIESIDLSTIDFGSFQDVEFKIEHPTSGNSYLYLSVV